MRLRRAEYHVVPRLSVVLGLWFVIGACAPGHAAVLTPDEAAARVLANGFTFVAKTEAAGASADDTTVWNVWASKFGIAYRVTVDAQTGDLTAAAPAVEDD